MNQLICLLAEWHVSEWLRQVLVNQLIYPLVESHVINGYAVWNEVT
jgi:hypothetical protein